MVLLTAGINVITSSSSFIFSPFAMAVPERKAKREARQIDESFVRSRVAAESLNEMKNNLKEYSDQKLADRKRRKTSEPGTLFEPSLSLESRVEEEQQAEEAGKAAQEALLEAEAAWIRAMKVLLDLVFERPDMK